MNAQMRILADESIRPFNSSGSRSVYFADVSGLVDAGAVGSSYLQGSRDSASRLENEARQMLRKFRRSQVPLPSIAKLDSEVLFVWSSGEFEAHVSLEGDGEFGYALKSGGRFKPGAEDGLVPSVQLPGDLVDYLYRMFPD